MRHHIENLKQRPEHIRHRVAFGVSAGATALVALVWFAAHAATGTFALSSPVPEETASTELAGAKTGFSQIAGAIGSVIGATSSDPGLMIVDGNTRSTLDAAPPENQNQTDATAIPF
jgi:hypothetical protein